MTTPSQGPNPAGRARAGRGSRFAASASAKARRRRYALEALEPRQLLSTLPAPTRLGASTVAAPGTTVDDSSPSVAIDPNDPTKLVAVWTQFNPGGGQTTVTAQGAYSTNSGASWVPFTIGSVLSNPTTSSPVVPFAQVTDATVAIDRSDNVYVVASQHAADNNSGAIVLNKFSFSGNAPTALITNKVLYPWTLDPALKPVVAVDAGSGTDALGNPNAAFDRFAGNVYVAWATNNGNPTNIANFNPNTIQAVVSSDGGATFSGQREIDDTNFVSSTSRFTAPQVVVSQGTADGRVAPGQVTFLWDDFAGGNNDQPVATDHLLVDRVTGGSASQTFSAAPGPITDAGASNAPSTTTFNIPVTIGDLSRFTTVSDLNVRLALLHPNAADLSITLVAPDGTTIPLVVVNNLAGANPGMSTDGATTLGLTLDDQSTRPLANGQAPFVGSFRTPNAGLPPALFPSLSSFNGLAATSARINGIWKLQITDSTTTTGQNAQNAAVREASLVFTSGLNGGTDRVAATTTVRGALTGAQPLATPSSPFGVGPGAVMAADNTLGADSPYQGRLYMAYVDRYNSALAGQRYNPDYGAAQNPADNTDIFLAYSDDGGQSWVRGKQVNSDNALEDGSSASFDSKVLTTGRPQYQPQLAVDQATGTLVASWYDTRDDAAKARVATYLSSSIDGGATFSPQAFANQPNQASDEATQATVTLGPIPDNQSAGNALRDANFSFGSRQGLAAYGGVAIPVWSGNLNVNSNGRQLHLGVLGSRMAIGAGPRAVDGTMGLPVRQAVVALDGTSIEFNAPDPITRQPRADGLIVTFDRPVDPSTFGVGDAEVDYRDVQTPGTSAPTAVLAVTSVVPLLDGSTPQGPTKFLVQFDAAGRTTGTYSYEVGPGVSDRIVSVTKDGTRAGNPMDQNANGTAGEASDVYAVPRPLASGASLPLMVPGPHLIGQQTYTAEPGQFPLPIPDNGTTLSSLTIGGDPGAEITSATVELSILHPNTGDLRVTLVAPDGTQVLLVQAGTPAAGSSRNLLFTTFDDSAAASIAGGSGPFTGTFRPASPLSAVVGKLAAGTWSLRVQDTKANNVGTIQGWSLTLGTTLVATDRAVSSFHVTFDRDMDPSTIDGSDVVQLLDPAGRPLPGPFAITPDPTFDPNNPDPDFDPRNPSAQGLYPRTFKVTLPAGGPATLSGGYALTLSPNIQARPSQAGLHDGDFVDANRNAGLDVLRSTPSAGTVPVTFNGTSAAIPAGGSVDSTITIAPGQNFQISGASVALNIAYPTDPDLTATLIAPGGQQVVLFSNVGQLGNQQNFTNTAFDDAAVTPVQNGVPPFFGTFNPKQPLGTLVGTNTAGDWTLRITNAGTATGTLSGWSLTLLKPLSSTGTGEPVADRSTFNFRIFTMDPSSPLSSATWTAVGPAGSGAKAANLNGQVSGPMSALAVDPSDPSGNTVYVGGSSGGVWKTTNFLTTDPVGPSYTPLTNSGPVDGENIGALAIIPRNGDTNQSIVIAGTGDPNALGDAQAAAINAQRSNYANRGVGFLLSADGGRTWALNDSTNNNLPFASRDHRFVNTVAYRIAVDPTPTPTGDYIIYAALSDLDPVTGAPVATGPSGGLWRSLDTGRTWQQMRAGQATDVLLDPNSASASTGNLQFLYAAFRGDGVYFSPNRGQVLNPVSGGIGDPLIQSADGATPVPVSVGGGATPNGAKGRIVLAKPALVPSTDPSAATKNLIYQGWLYAAVAATGDVYGNASRLDGLYMTKDFGQNWVKVRTPQTSALPTNDRAATDIDPTGVRTPQGTGYGTANAALSLAIDPNNPNVVYLGGSNTYGTTGLIRVDTTGISDAHSFYLAQGDDDGGTTRTAGRAAAIESNPNAQLPQQTPPYQPQSNPTLNFIRDPSNIFITNATIQVTNTTGFANTGGQTKWIPLDRALAPDPYADPTADPAGVPTTGVHRILTMVDPLTRQTRLLIADDQGVFTAVVAADGGLVGSVGQTGGGYTISNLPDLDTNAGTMPVARGSRNGNLQAAQFYAGAVQASNASAQLSALRGLFYGATDGTGYPQSDPNEIDPKAAGSGYGNLNWLGPISTAVRGTGTDVAVAQDFVVVNGKATATGAVYQYKLPESLVSLYSPPGVQPITVDERSTDPIAYGRQLAASPTDFLQVNGFARTFGLVRGTAGGDVPDQNWPFRTGSRLMVNPLNGDQMLISGQDGTIFGTENQGQTWVVIGNPGALDGTYAPALAYGAPDPNGPGGVGNLNNLAYAGTLGGHVFVTQTGGGGNGNQWSNTTANNITFKSPSNGLDGSAVESIITNPARGSHEAYAVVDGGTTGSYPSDSTQAIAIPDSGSVASTNAVPDDIYIDTLTVTYNIAHSRPGTLTVKLTAPDGSVYNLPAGPGNAAVSVPLPTNRYLFASDPTNQYGKSLRGTWTLTVTDTASDNTSGTINSWSLDWKSLGGVYHNAGTTTSGHWDGVAGNVFRIQQPAFGNAGQADTTARTLTSVVADWSYLLPDSLLNPSAGGSHPMLYASADSGVYRSADGGRTWTPFPQAEPSSVPSSTTPNPPGSGGGLPTVAVTDLDLALGNVDPTNGRPRARIDVLGNDNPADPSTYSDDITSENVLMASTFGRGAFAVRLAPVVFAASLKLDPTAPAPNGSDSGTFNGDEISNVARPFIAGLSKQSAFGEDVTITLYDETDPANPVAIGTGATDASGHFSVQVNANVWKSDGTSDGKKTIGVQAKDTLGTLGNIALFSFVLDTTPPNTTPQPPLPPPDLEAATDSGIRDYTTNFNNAATSPSNAPKFDVGTAAVPIEVGATVELWRAPVVGGAVGTPILVGFAVNTPGGVVTIADQNPNPADPTHAPRPGTRIPDGVYQYTARQIDLAGNAGPFSAGETVTIRTTPPVIAAPDLTDATDTGRPRTPDSIQRDKDNITNIPQPDFQGNVDPSATVTLFVNGVAAGTTTADASGYYLITTTVALNEGDNQVTAQETDIFGNTSVVSPALTVTLDTVPPGAIIPKLDPASDTGDPTDGNTSINRPAFIGDKAEPGALVQIYAQQASDLNPNPNPLVLAGEAVAAADGTYRVVVGTYVLPLPAETIDHLDDGSYDIFAVQTDVAGNRGRQTVFGNPGTVVIDGTDADDHGDYNSTTNQNELGWLYMQKVLENIGPNITNGNKTITALIGEDPNSGFNQAADSIKSALRLSALASQGWTVQFVFGTQNVDDFLSGKAVGNVRLATTGILYISTVNNAAGDLSDNDQVVLNAHGADIADFVNAGGGLYSQAESPFFNNTPAYGWLTSLFPTITAVQQTGFGNDFTLTPAGQAAFPGLSNSDLQGGPWHNYFDAPGGDFTPLTTLATASDFTGVVRTLILTTTVGTAKPVVVTIDTHTPPVPGVPDLEDSSDSPFPGQANYRHGTSDADNLTNVTSPVFDVAGLEADSTLELYRDGKLVNSVPTGAGGVVSIQDPGPTAPPDGSHVYQVRQVITAGTPSALSAGLTVTFDTTAPTATSAPDLQAASDTGRSNTDNNTSATSPVFDVSPAEATGTVELLRDGVPVASRVGPGSIQDPGPVPDGVHVYTTRQTDLAGNVGPVSAGLSVTIDATPPASPTPPDLQALSDTPLPGQPGYTPGVTDTDNVTANNRPIFDVAATEATALVQLLRTRVVSAVGAQANVAIPDGPSGSPARSTISIAAGQPIVDVNLAVTIAHGRASDLVLTLIAPDGTRVPLAANRGGLGANYTATTFDDQAAVAITAGSAPFGGAFRPESPLSALIGKAAAGTWTLEVADTRSGTTGTIVGWSLAVATAADVVATGAVDAGTLKGTLQDPGVVPDGVYSYATRQVDVAGNVGPLSTGLIVTVDTTTPQAPGAPDLEATSDSPLPGMPGYVPGVTDTDNLTSATIVRFPVFDVAPAEAGATVRLYRDGVIVATRTGPGPIADPGPSFADGRFSYTVDQVDVAGNISPRSAALVVTIDDTAPTVTSAPDLEAASDSGFSSTDNITSVTNPVFDVAGVEAGATLLLLRNGVVVATVPNAAGGTVAVQDPGPVPDGSYSYTAYLVDKAGNASPISGGLAVTINTNGVPTFTPGVPDLADASDSGASSTDNVTSATSPTFNVAPVEAGVRVQLVRSGPGGDVVVASRVGPGAIADPGPVADGTYLYRAREVDAAGNVGPASAPLSVTIDTVALPPSAPALQPGSDSGRSSSDGVTNVTSPTFDVATAEPNATVRLLRDGVQVATRSGPGALQDPGPLGNGSYRYTAVQVDLAGNVSTASPASTITVLATSPSSPSAPDLQAGSDTGTSSTDNITGATSPIFDVTGALPGATVRLLNNNIVVATATADASGKATLQDPGPLADGTYSYTAAQVDVAGNVSAAGPALTVIIQLTAPAGPGVPDLDAASDSGASSTDNVTNVRGGAGNPAPRFTVAGAGPGATVRLLRDNVQVNAVVAPQGGGTVSITDPGPVPEGVHNYTTVQVSAVGDVSAPSAALAVTFDATAPAVANLSLVDPSGNALGAVNNTRRPGVSGTTEPGATVVLSTGGVAIGTATADGKTGAFVVRPSADLARDGSYTLAVAATDLAGNAGAAGTIADQLDTTPPAAPIVGLNTADDTGVKGDGVTTVRRPRLTGSVGTGEAGSTLQLRSANGTVLGTAVAGSNGAFTLVPSAALPFGPQALNVRAVDRAGNAGPAVPLSLNVAQSPGDYDADRRADLAAFTPGTAVWSLLQSQAGARTQQFGAANDVPLTGDFDGDGKQDFAVYRPSTATWYIIDSGGGSKVLQFGQANVDQPIPADFDGDGKTDLAVYRPTTGQWLILQTRDGGRVVSFGQAGVDQPVPADYDGDGRADLAVYRPTTGQWLISGSSGVGRVYPFGAPGAVPIPADYDGDGKADPAVFFPATAEWAISRPTGAGRLVQFGQANVDIPVPQDYDGDGLADLAVFRPTTAQWIILNSAGGSQVQVDGRPGDVPVPAPYSYRQSRAVIGSGGGGGGVGALGFAVGVSGPGSGLNRPSAPPSGAAAPGASASAASVAPAAPAADATRPAQAQADASAGQGASAGTHRLARMRRPAGLFRNQAHLKQHRRRPHA